MSATGKISLDSPLMLFNSEKGDATTTSTTAADNNKTLILLLASRLPLLKPEVDFERKDRDGDVNDLMLFDLFYKTNDGSLLSSSLFDRSKAKGNICVPVGPIPSTTFTAVEQVFTQFLFGLCPIPSVASWCPWVTPNGKVSVEVMSLDDKVVDLKESMRRLHRDEEGKREGLEENITVLANEKSVHNVMNTFLTGGTRIIILTGPNGDMSRDKTQDLFSRHPDFELSPGKTYSSLFIVLSLICISIF